MEKGREEGAHTGLWSNREMESLSCVCTQASVCVVVLTDLDVSRWCFGLLEVRAVVCRVCVERCCDCWCAARSAHIAVSWVCRCIVYCVCVPVCSRDSGLRVTRIYLHIFRVALALIRARARALLWRMTSQESRGCVICATATVWPLAHHSESGAFSFWLDVTSQTADGLVSSLGWRLAGFFKGRKQVVGRKCELSPILEIDCQTYERVPPRLTSHELTRRFIES